MVKVGLVVVMRVGLLGVMVWEGLLGVMRVGLLRVMRVDC